ncbi:MAG: hypothetical protein HRJ53_29500 [Acidobacteria bacterium Pan2503]|uniref:Uncharacterized protein n=1 Tax=Candidatus Acidiferrum panamense TaxID=2741543 RepID=A0A7V8T0M5_9BACT|nr:hypothetical protein [Candidatus Acidoferrum panamensis]
MARSTKRRGTTPSTWVMVDMTPERKALWNETSKDIIELVRKRGLNPLEAHSVLTHTANSIASVYEILETKLLRNATEVKQ